MSYGLEVVEVRQSPVEGTGTLPGKTRAKQVQKRMTDECLLKRERASDARKRWGASTVYSIYNLNYINNT